MPRFCSLSRARCALPLYKINTIYKKAITWWTKQALATMAVHFVWAGESSGSDPSDFSAFDYYGYPRSPLSQRTRRCCVLKIFEVATILANKERLYSKDIRGCHCISEHEDVVY